MFESQYGKDKGTIQTFVPNGNVPFLSNNHNYVRNMSRSFKLLIISFRSTHIIRGYCFGRSLKDVNKKKPVNIKCAYKRLRFFANKSRKV